MSEKEKEGDSSRGRPSKFREEMIELAYNYALLGLTDAQIAGVFEIDEATLYRWKNIHEEFCEALKNGREIADAKVVGSLFKRACGYETTEVKEHEGVDGKSTTTTKKEVPPDTGAMAIWLKNRQPKLWRDRQEVVTKNVNVTIDSDDPQEVSRQYQELMGD